ncbi:protein of unknown function DUF1501 [Pirellula staleyi DSM 6068]|uniref:DUF1501 domain-containing protein n=1 Tax=Pirellula staleyi (strain ATCC 27377 / DSM 6068 / ICPB 4128) TaxID=530564 RepID=D2QYW2_PIRSD|nr:protein of unknown function DUF1501 [Pirellula staleyi DSM 6068]
MISRVACIPACSSLRMILPDESLPRLEIAMVLSIQQRSAGALHSCRPDRRSSPTRRELLSIGTLALGGLMLPQLLEAEERIAQKSWIKKKSVVVLFLGGGASHIETFNPNMDAPQPYSSITGEVQTTVPGMTFGGTFPKLASVAKQMAVVRSFSHGIGDHVKAIAHVLSGGTDPTGEAKLGYGMGCATAKLGGATHPQTGLPMNSIVTSEEVDSQYRTERGRIERGAAPNALGSSVAPFNPSGGGTMLKNMELSLPIDRLDDRQELLAQLDRVDRQLDTSGAMLGTDRFQQQAIELIVRGAKSAFDLSKEDPRTIQRYDTRKFRVGKKSFQPSQLGRQMLLARRLCESGCRFVTVQSSGWDMHADGNNPGVAAGMEMLGRPLDHAVHTFLTDLAERGLDRDVLLVITGDFGRTPTINKNGGRDHYPKLGTLAFAGGGLKLGQVIGSSTAKNDAPASDPISPAMLCSTVMRTLFDPGQLRLDSSVPRDLAQLAEGRYIEELF